MIADYFIGARACIGLPIIMAIYWHITVVIVNFGISFLPFGIRIINVKYEPGRLALAVLCN